MIQLNKALSSPAERDEADLFRYGWREVPHRLPNGKTEYERVPLSLEDVLHPEYGDVMPKASAHDEDLYYLLGVLKKQVADEPTALVLCDVLIFWDNSGLRQHSPDLSVIFGVRDRKDNYTSFDVASEGVRPTLLVEVVSPNYRVNDVETKVEQYHRAGVPWYVIVDRERDDGPLRLIGYHYAPAGYEPLPLDEQGRLWLEPVRLWLGIQGNRVICYDGETGKELGDYTQVSQELAAAEECVAEEVQARRAAEERVAEEVQARRAAEERVAEEVQARRAAEKRVAEEVQARRAAEDRQQALEEELRRMRGK